MLVTQQTVDIELTQGNLNNNHFYLRRHLDFFPAEAVGGSSRKEGEGKLLTVHFKGIDQPALTDIAGGNKLFFRSRGVIGQFFDFHRLKAGDEVRITRLSEYEYRVTPTD